jgi:hypothetical protein
MRSIAIKMKMRKRRILTATAMTTIIIKTVLSM